MSFLSKLFGRPSAPPPQVDVSEASDPLVPVPIPALGVLLLDLEKQKGAPLSEQEVLLARDKAVCMMLPLSKKRSWTKSGDMKTSVPRTPGPSGRRFGLWLTAMCPNPSVKGTYRKRAAPYVER